MAIKTFTGRVDARGHLIITQAQAYQAHLLRLKGSPVQVTVTRPYSQRSTDQNAWLHGVALPILSEVTGYDLHEWPYLKVELLKKCFGSVWDARLGIEIPNEPSTAKLSTEKFAIFMDWLVRFAATELNGTLISLPNEGVSHEHESRPPEHDRLGPSEPHDE